MAQSKFLTLPSELILCICAHLDSFTDVIALALTAPIFYDVWKLNTATISYFTILPKILKYIDEARVLFDAQHDAGLAQWRPGDDYQSVVHNTKHFYSNARCISRVCDLFDTELGDHPEQHWPHHPPNMTSSERVRFTRVCYLACAYLTLASMPDPRERLCSFLAARTMNELVHIRGLALWMSACMPESLGLPSGDMTGNGEGSVESTNTWANGLETMAEHWSKRVAGKVNVCPPFDWGYNPPALIVIFNLRLDLTDFFAKACIQKGIKR